MISRNWPSASAADCATRRPRLRCLCGLLLFAFAAAAQEKVPAIALLDGADAVQWQNWTRELGWQVIADDSPTDKNIDLRVLSLAAKVEAAIKSGKVAASRIYLAGRGDGASAVFYTIARLPDLWAAAAALGGSPKPAIDSGRFFAVNFTNVPLIWISGDEGKPFADKLAAANVKIEW